MKVGSVVECVCNSFKIMNGADNACPKKGDIDTVISVNVVNGTTYLELERFPEDGFTATSFREVQLPNYLMEQIEECLTRELTLIP